MILEYYAAVTLYALLHALDLWSTHHALVNLGAREVNPVVRLTVQHLGVLRGLISLKVLAVLPFILIHPSHHMVTVLVGLIIVYTIMVINNYRVIRRMS